MQTQFNVNPTSIIEVEKMPNGKEKFSFTLDKGKLKTQEIEALLEFNFIIRPFNGLRVIHNMLYVYMLSNDFEEIEVKEAEALREVLNLFTNLWAAENDKFEAMDLTFF